MKALTSVLLIILTVQIVCSKPFNVILSKYGLFENPKNKKCDDGVTIERPCSYEECLTFKFPSINVCGRWNELDFIDKMKECSITVNAPCQSKINIDKRTQNN